MLKPDKLSKEQIIHLKAQHLISVPNTWARKGDKIIVVDFDWSLTYREDVIKMSKDISHFSGAVLEYTVIPGQPKPTTESAKPIYIGENDVDGIRRFLKSLLFEGGWLIETAEGY